VWRGRTTILHGRTLGCLLAIALCLPSRPAAASAAPAAGAEALASRLQRIEAAFRGGDAGALRASFTTRGKLRLDVPQVPGCPASYGAGQLQVIFGQLFAAARTRSFAFEQEDAPSSDDTAFARALWRRDDPHDGGQALTFTLREEDGDWRIHEIVAPR